MKTIYKFGYLTLFSVLIIGNILAQDIMDVPPFDADNEHNLFNAVTGDTTDTGERANLNRIYRLERGSIYLLSSTINANYPLRMIAGGDESLRPPIIIGGKFVDGANIKPLINLTGDNDRHYFKDLLFNGADLNRTYVEFGAGIISLGDNQSVTYEGCIFNAFTGGATRFEGADAKIYIRDCEWRNGVSSTHMFIGQQVTLPALPVDTLIVTNNTYFNNNAFWIFHENGIVRFQVIEHNTVFTNLVDPLRIRFASNTNIKSNIFYGTMAYGDSDEFRQIKAYEPDNSPTGIISIYEAPSDKLDDVDLTESERVINVTHNAYFTPQPIKDYWESNAEVDDDISFMNTRTTALFADFMGHAKFYAADNYNMDPNFSDTDAHDFVVNGVVDFCTTYRATLTPGSPLTGDAGTVRNYDESRGKDLLTEIEWPLPEHLGYTNATLLSGGHDGLPVGDLNWHDGMREQYVEPTTTYRTGTDDVVEAVFDLYPNPAQTEINISSPETITKVEIYSILGNLVASISTDSTEEVIDISTLQPGNYILKLATKNGVSARSFVKK